ncbi:hypothetical protein ACOMHN_004267 [Nucella lapillus]
MTSRNEDEQGERRGRAGTKMNRRNEEEEQERRRTAGTKKNRGIPSSSVAVCRHEDLSTARKSCLVLESCGCEREDFIAQGFKLVSPVLWL